MERRRGLGHRRGARAGFGLGLLFFLSILFSLSFLFSPAPLEGDSRGRAVQDLGNLPSGGPLLFCPPDPSSYIKQDSCQKITGEFELRKNKNPHLIVNFSFKTGVTLFNISPGKGTPGARIQV